ncbi:ABC transporter permease [Prosthecomicrobium sp. N25]|uniref:ABC transporter permease n=1 Tax=Prosthecomicrobium sp. N25 TaxID=3129254 RepID=UPI003077358A
MPEMPRLGTEGWLFVVILLLGAVWSLLTPWFLTLPNAVDILETWSVTTILALGVFVVLVAGGIDISFAATASVAQYAAAWAAQNAGWPPALAIPLGLVVGVALGCLNAALIHYLNITSIIVTIATQSLYFALLMWWTGGKLIPVLPDWWSDRIVFFQTEAADGSLVRITLPIVVAATAVLVTWTLMTRLSAGRQLYCMGGNPEAARRLGIDIARMHFLAYGFLGLMAGLAGLVQAHRVGQSVPNAMVGQELNVVAAAVLGGASLNGGIGTVRGVLLGLLLLAILQNGLNLLGWSSYFFPIVIGLVILVSTSITGLAGRPGRRRARAGEVVHG